MTTSKDWYCDPDRLLEELVKQRRERVQPPSVPGYTDFEEIHRGGQGIVYRALQQSTRRHVAVKVLLGGAYASHTARQRFEREIELVSRLRHEHVVRVYDCGLTADDRLYLVMEYIDGAALDKHALLNGTVSEAAQWPLSRRLDLFATICDAVNFAHQHGVIHRDLKPGNILIDDRGQPHVLDFGLAKADWSDGVEPAAAAAVSRTGYFFGSVPWASPEHVRGAPEAIDVRSDVYSLGVVLYQILTGELPYDLGTNLHEALGTIMSVEPRGLTVPGRRFDDDLETIVRKCLAKEPDRRYQTAADLARDIRHFRAGEPIDARRDSAWYTMTRRLRRYRVAVALTLLLIAASVAFGINMTLLYRRAAQAESLASNRLVTARTAEDLARAEAAKATAINEFLEQMLASPDPNVMDREVTVRQALDRARDRVAQQLAGVPLVQASVLSVMGWTYFNLGEYEAAEPVLREAVKIYDAERQTRSEEAIHARHRLAQVLMTQQKYREAEALSAEVLETSRQMLGDQAWMTIAAAVVRADLLFSIGRQAESEALFRQTIERSSSALGPQHHETLVAKNNFAIVLMDLGQYEQALELLESVLAAYRSARLPNEAAVISPLNNLARIHQARGRLAQARAALEELLERSKQIFGPHHSRTLTATQNLISVLLDAGEHKEAEALIRQLVDYAEEHLGATHDTTLRALNNLVVLLLDRSQYADAEPTARRVLDTLQAKLQEGTHPPPMVVLNLATAIRGQGRAAEAEGILRQVIQDLRADYGADHPEEIWLANELGKCLLDTGRVNEAEQLFRSAIEQSSRQLGADHWISYVLRMGLGRSLAATRQYQDAETELTNAYKFFSTNRGAQNAKTQTAVKYLIELYEQCGQPEKVEEWRNKL